MPNPEEIIDHETGEILSRPVSMQPAGKPSFSEARITTSGVRLLSELSQSDFVRRIEMMRLGKARMRDVQRSLLDENIDYGVIPGTKKNTLFKSGAEKFAEFFQFATSYKITRTIGDGVTTPTIHYMVECFVHLGSTDGPIIHAGAGAANSWEVKYRYRNTGRKCPSCGKETIIKTKGNDRYPAGYWCGTKNGGCGANFAIGDAVIEDQVVGKSDTPDPYELENTLLKMAKKRAYVDGIIGATATSELFTQDIGDTGAGDHGDRREEPPADRQDYGNGAEQEPMSTAKLYVSTSSKPVTEGAGANTGSARADAMILAFRKSASVTTLEKLSAVFSKWPEAERALLKDEYNRRHKELSGS